MRKFLLGYLLPRFVQYLVVIFIGVTLTFVIPRLSPADPVERQIGQLMSTGAQINPEAVIHLREALTEMYGLEGSTLQQYGAFWGRLLRADLGPSLATFPTPVISLIQQALPWTLGLLLTTTLISWLLGNFLGALASFFPRNPLLRVIDILSQAVRPIPYYVMALVLLVLFAYFIPIFPFSGAYPAGTHVEFSWPFMLTVLKHSALPAISLVIVGIGSWYIGMKALASNIISEDYVVYAETTGLRPMTVVYGYVVPNAILPQITGLAMQLGTIFSGSLMMEIVFGYPGMGMLFQQAVMANDYSLIMGITLLSIVGVASAVFLLDLLYPLFDPRVRYQ